MWTLICFVLYNVLLTSESMDGILYCDHFNESYWAEISSGAVNKLYKMVPIYEPGR